MSPSIATTRTRRAGFGRLVGPPVVCLVVFSGDADYFWFR
jgi:hypothetical protein